MAERYPPLALLRQILAAQGQTPAAPPGPQPASDPTAEQAIMNLLAAGQRPVPPPPPGLRAPVSILGIRG